MNTPLRNHHVVMLTLIALFGARCGTAVTSVTPSPSAAPIVSAFTTTSGTAIGTTGTTDVPIASAFAITFSTAMDTSTLTTSTLTLTCSSSSQTVTVATTGNTGATITPASSMPEGATCILTVTTGAKSATGVAVAAAVTFTFTTTASVPEVSSVTGTAASTGSSATIATTGTTDVSGAVAAPLTLTFSLPMSTSTVTGGATLQCPSGTSMSPTVASTSSTVFTVTPTSALPQMTNCVLGLPATIQSSNGNALTATSYTYTTGCGTSDTFGNAATFSSASTVCWTPANANLTSTFAITGGVLDITIPAGTTTEFPTVPYARKTFPSTTSSIVVTTKVTFSGIIDGNDRCSVTLLDSGSGMSIKGTSISVFPNGGAKVQAVDFTDAMSSEVAVAGSTIYVRLTLSGGVITPAYSADNVTFTNFDATFAFTGTSGSILAELSAGHSAVASTTVCQFDDFTVTGATATGQYSN